MHCLNLEGKKFIMNCKFLLIRLLIFFFSIFTASAQKIDSLLGKLKTSNKEDVTRLKLLNCIAGAYEDTSPQKGLDMADQAIVLAIKLNKPEELAVAYQQKGGNYYAAGAYPEAMNSFQKALNIAEQVGDKNLVSLCYSNLGSASQATGDHAACLTYYQKALDINTALDNEHTMSIILGNMGAVYLQVSQYEKAMEHLQKAFQINEKRNDLEGMTANLANMGFIYMTIGKQQEALKTISRALDLDEKSGNKAAAAEDLTYLGMLYGDLSDQPNSLKCFQKSLRYSEEVGDRAGIAIATANIGTHYETLSDYPTALAYYHKALSLNETLGRKKGMAAILGSIGVIYEDLGDYNKAIQYHQKALAIHEKIGDKKAAADNLSNIGSSYFELTDYRKSIDYFNQAMDINTGLGINDVDNLHNIGAAYNAMLYYDTAFDYLQRSFSISDSSGSKEITAKNLYGLGLAYANISNELLGKTGVKANDRFPTAINLIRLGLDTALAIQSLELQRDAWQSLSTVYEKQKDYANSIEAYKKYIVLRDSMVNDKKKKEITRLELQYEYSKREDSIKLQQQLTSEKLTQQQLFARQQAQKLELNKKELDLSNKEKDIQKLAYLKTQADLQNEQLQKQQKIKQLTLSEKEKQLQSSQLTTLSQDKILNKLTQQRLWLLAAGAFTLVVFTALFFLYRTRIRQLKLSSQLVQQKNEQQIKEAEFQHKLGDITLSALRSQMNPHFIFNCLNSIKLYAAQNDSKAASDYLTKFSRLIRQMLENSRSERISLTNEMQSLELYIQMEAMRFKEKLQYQITVDKNIDSDYIEIPPLLIQPYVENAIWHGLMQKEEGGHIAIHLSKNENDDMLTATVTDNGIGRKKATEIKSKSATKHKSYGMKVTSERIALINQVYNSNTTVEVTDLYSENGEPTGTTVVIQIPI
jgi:tetratricopeptide (TPR) repeat protein